MSSNIEQLNQEEIEKVIKENKMLKKIKRLDSTDQGQPFGPAEYYIHDVERFDEAILLSVSNKDSVFLKTTDDRKVDDNGNKYSNIRILYLKSEINDIPADFLRKGDVVKISGIFANGVLKRNLDEEFLKSFKEKDLANQIFNVLKDNVSDKNSINNIIESLNKGEVTGRLEKIVLDHVENIFKGLTLYTDKIHMYGFKMKSVKLTDETYNAIKEFRKVEKERRQEQYRNNEIGNENSESKPEINSTHNETNHTQSNNTLTEQNTDTKTDAVEQTEVMNEPKQEMPKQESPKQEANNSSNSSNPISDEVNLKGISFSWDE